MALRLEKTCPKCGSNLMLREGVNGDFLACPKSPGCRYTESIPDSRTPLYFRSEDSKYCKKCNHTGLLPFAKDGNVIPNAYINCECRVEDEPYHYLNIDTEDFDFPMSQDFREYTFKQYGRPWEKASSTPPASECSDVSTTNEEIAELNRQVIKLTGEVCRLKTQEEPPDYISSKKTTEKNIPEYRGGVEHSRS